MSLEYFATNKIPIQNDQDRDEYLNLCFWYLTGWKTSLPKTFQKKIIEERNKLYKKLQFYEVKGGNKAKLLPSESLDDFKITNVGNVGFVEDILYDKTESCFKLRIFYDKCLEKGGLDTLFEPMRNYLTTDPKSVGLEVIKEQEDGLEKPDFPYPLRRAKVSYARYLDEEIKDAKKEAGLKLENLDAGEDYSLYREMIADAKDRLRSLEVRKKYLSEQSYKQKLKKITNIFERVRNDFSKKFPEQLDINDTAFGTFPFMHTIIDANGICDEIFRFLPNYSSPINLLDAEIFVKTENGCKIIISIYPYVSIFPEINEFHTGEFLEDEDLSTALFAHEFGHIVRKDEVKVESKPIKINIIDYATDGWYRLKKLQEEKNDVLAENIKINSLLSKIGYGKENKKLIKRYKEKYKEIMENHKGKDSDMYKIAREGFIDCELELSCL
ncbi:MAG: hypothetical protein JSV92_02785 [archaeon]|nr:MAG: hypothetical protein JSV92_02785 [archaeon]